MTVQEWLTSDVTIEKSKRPYARFDYRTDIQQQRSYLSNLENMKQHGFYPFIHYKQKQVKSLSQNKCICGIMPKGDENDRKEELSSMDNLR